MKKVAKSNFKNLSIVMETFNFTSQAGCLILNFLFGEYVYYLTAQTSK